MKSERRIILVAAIGACAGTVIGAIKGDMSLMGLWVGLGTSFGAAVGYILQQRAEKADKASNL